MASNALAGIRPAAYSSVSYTAFRLVDGRTSELRVTGSASTLKEAVEIAQRACDHKDCLAIREHDELNERVTIHLYAIRKKKATWVYAKPGDYLPSRVEDLYAAPLCSMDGEVLR